MWDTKRHTNICITKNTRRRGEKRLEIIFKKIMAVYFLNLMKALISTSRKFNELQIGHKEIYTETHHSKNV